jgi:hypothetical protein
LIVPAKPAGSADDNKAREDTMTFFDRAFPQTISPKPKTAAGAGSMQRCRPRIGLGLGTVISMQLASGGVVLVATAARHVPGMHRRPAQQRHPFPVT